jgi:3-oxoadipate enol-lactonase/4-carboxymuconolactone decarboxylase
MFTTINGITFHYTIDRSDDLPGNPPLLFLNAIGTDMRIWERVLPLLTVPGARIRYDARGHGLSECPPAPYTLVELADDAVGILDALGIEQAIAIGISMGGLTAQAMALRHPDRVKALVLCDTAPRIGTAELWQSRMERIRQNGMASIGDATMKRWFPARYHAEYPGEIRGWQSLVTRMPAEGYLATCGVLAESDLSNQVGQIHVPTLALCGSEDVATPPAQMRELVETLPNARFALVEGAGHLPCIDHPATFATLINEFVASLDAAPSAYERGMAIRRSVLGSAHVERATANQTDLDSDFQRFITEMVWGTVWARGGLTRKTRHLITLAVLAALGREQELVIHLRATINTGVTPDDLRELLMQVAVYAGVPAANSAFALAKKILAERETP